MSKLITLTMTENERAEFEALLDAYIEEIRKDKGEHERIMARVDERLSQIKWQTDARHFSERILRLEVELEHQKEQQAAERENFRLQLENLRLRLQQGLPPSEKSEKDEDSDLSHQKL